VWRVPRGAQAGVTADSPPLPSFQIPPLVTGGTSLVICPLLALAYDQVAALHRRGVSAVVLRSARG